MTGRVPHLRLLAGALMLASAACLRGSAGELLPEERFTRWTRFEAEPGATHFSALAQIDRSNVQHLEVAWTYPLGDNATFSFNPIVIDTVMYAFGTGGSVVALQAETGRPLWSHTPGGEPGRVRFRGITYWEDATGTDRRLFFAKGNFLHAVDAGTGRPIPEFGSDGVADLRQGIARDPETLNVGPASPGVIFENLIILGSAPGESYGSGPGDIRAFDVRTGELVWVFHTIPHPGEYGYDTWPTDAWQRSGGANAWGGMSVDVERAMVFIPLGAASYDFYGVDRPGANLFANSLVALDARTGQRIWHFQTVHHDLWDYDLAATPTLLTVRHDGRSREVVAQASKQGFLFVFDRETGEPLWPIEERPVPASDMPGEEAWPTQPFPTWPLPFAEQSFTEEDINPYILDAAERDSLRRLVRESHNLGLFTPPSTRPTMQMPGNSGGANWGMSAADPRDGTFYVVSKNVPTMLRLSPMEPGELAPGISTIDRGRIAYQQNCSACHLPGRGGQPPIIPSLEGVVARSSPDDVRNIVRQGQGQMPAFPELPEADVNAIIAYLAAPERATDPGAAPAGVRDSAAATGPVRYSTPYGYLNASGGMWARRPPYMTMTAYDLNSGAIRWQIPLGEVESLAERGITGVGHTQFRAGPAVTGGGLLFQITGRFLRAYDRDDGAELWVTELPWRGDGIPAVYQVRGTQYVAVSAAHGGGSSDPPAPQAYVVFALPDSLR